MTILPDLSTVDRVALDTETNGLGYGNRPVGLAWRTADGRRGYARWGHEKGGNNCALADVIRWARVELRRPGLTVVMHNAAFDLRMLAYVGVEIGCRVEDTGIIAALLNEHEPDFSLNGLASRHCGLTKSDDELNALCARLFGGRATRQSQAANYWRVPGDAVEAYAVGDVDLTDALFLTLRPKIEVEGLTSVYADETALIPTMLRMHLLGTRVDMAAAERVKTQLGQRLAQAQARWVELAGNVNPNSSKQLAPLFDRYGLAYPKTEAGNPSITKEVLAGHDHELATTLRHLRQLGHYAGTFIDNYILKNVAADGCVHGEFHQVRREKYGTISGRFSSGGALNLQNIPARDEEWAPLIRGLFIPYSESQDWLKIDYSQIEYRFFAHYAGGALREAYRASPQQDFHQMVMDLTGLKRKQAKNANFAKLYGAGLKTFAQTAGMSMDDAAQVMATYDARIPEAKELYSLAANRASARGQITTWGGRKARFKPAGRGYDKTYTALNRLLQGSAADLMKRAMVRVAAEIDWTDTRLHLTVHDELDLSVPRGEAGERVARRLRDLMEEVELTVPILAEAELGRSWGDTTPVSRP